MKKILLLSVGVIFLLFIVSTDIYAQGKSNQKSNAPKKEVPAKGKSDVSKKPGPPPWAPAHGYRAKTRYVYFKDYDVYYDHTRGVYISISGGKWVLTTQLPRILARVDLVKAARIDLDFDGNEPQREHAIHKKKYPKKK